MALKASCESCIYYEYDEEYGYYVCTAALDEDEMRLFILGRSKDCPYYRGGDEYTIVRKQN